MCIHHDCAKSVYCIAYSTAPPGSVYTKPMEMAAHVEAKHQQLMEHRFCEADVLDWQAPTLLSMMIASSYMGPPWRLRLLLARWRACAHIACHSYSADTH